MSDIKWGIRLMAETIEKVAAAPPNESMSVYRLFYNNNNGAHVVEYKYYG